MPPLHRRDLLGALAAASALAGCSVPVDSRSPTETPTPTATPSTSERIRIDVRNQEATETIVEIQLTAPDDETLLDRQVAVPGNDRRALDTGIDETGEYDLDASVVGSPDPSVDATVDVERYDLDNGSNVILLVEGERIEMWMEE